MMQSCILSRISLYFLAAALIAGCSRSPKTAFYTLNATAQTERTPSRLIDSVIFGQVTLPDLLDRPQLVVRLDTNRVEILELQRWAEPLKSEIPRVIARNLSILLNTDKVSVYPQTAGIDAAFRINIDIQQMELIEGKGVSVDLLWSIRRPDRSIIRTGRSTAGEAVSAAGYDGLVAAQSRALAAVSRELAAVLREIATGQK